MIMTEENMFLEDGTPLTNMHEEVFLEYLKNKRDGLQNSSSLTQNIESKNAVIGIPSIIFNS